MLKCRNTLAELIFTYLYFIFKMVPQTEKIQLSPPELTH